MLGNPGLCVKEQTRWRLAATMNTLPRMSLKGSNMIEKTASVHWEGPGKKGQGQIGRRMSDAAIVEIQAA